MGSLGPTDLIALLVAVATSAAICGFVASAASRRNKRRARGFFLLGFFCGLMTSAILRGRRRGFAVRAFAFAASHVRQVSRRLPMEGGPPLARLLTGSALMLRLRP
jgi:hypothetical protein